MYHKVKNYMEKNNMLQKGDTVLMGVSGGGDSMTMLRILHQLKSQMEIDLRVIHVHHGIRGEEADRDRDMVSEICREWLIPCSIYYYDVPVLSKEWRMGVEETGRLVRKNAFEKEIEKLGIAGANVKIALAHNKNDLAETMLHNLARGSGLRGMSGIQAVSGNIIRPLLCLERKEIDQFLECERIPYITDSTNQEDHYTRNRIRHHILPVLEQEINSQAIAHMAEAAGIISEADAYLQKEGCVLAEKFCIGKKKYCLTEDFWKNEKILKSYAVMEILGDIAGKRKDLTQLHVEQVLESISLQSGKQICLPYNIVVRRVYHGIILEEKREIENDNGEIKEIKLDILSEKDEFCAEKDFYVKIFPYTGQKICEKKYTKWFDYDKIRKDLSVRTRKNGDYIVIDKSGKRKKLARYMIDEKIPKEERESLLLLTVDHEVIWIIGRRISEKYKISQTSTRVLEISYQGGKENG